MCKILFRSCNFMNRCLFYWLNLLWKYNLVVSGIQIVRMWGFCDNRPQPVYQIRSVNIALNAYFTHLVMSESAASCWFGGLNVSYGDKATRFKVNTCFQFVAFIRPWIPFTLKFSRGLCYRILLAWSICSDRFPLSVMHLLLVNCRAFGHWTSILPASCLLP